MKKVVFRGSLLILLALFCSGIFAAEPVDYKIVYRNQWTHDNETRIMKTTVLSQANLKFRLESESVDESKDNAKPTPTVWIVRLDKHLTWRLDSSKNFCTEQPYDETRMGRSFFISEERKGHLSKNGEESILGYPCDIYVDDAATPAKYWISKEHSILLKAEYDLNGSKYISEATELKFEPQESTAFDVPQGYKMLKIMSKEELDKLPPITLAQIDTSLFSQYESLRISPKTNGESRILTAAEIEILRNSIKNGSQLAEIPNESLSLITTDPSNAVFTIEWSGKEIGNFWFNKTNGYIYINKMSVFHNDLKERYFDVNWVKKFVQGAFRFKPSADLLKLIN
ncbi:MAG TPA: hypothetical protein VHR47_11620 [Bacillota bacterium]|nr:hypothetical protein [Bacillota bacterium]